MISEMHVKLIGLLLLLSSYSVQGQAILTWEDLAEVEWKESINEETGFADMTAQFSEHLLSYQGKEVIISGYVIPLDAMGLSYALSKTSFASCFFCGKAGPETVLDLNVRPKSIKPYRQKTELIKFKGVLVLKESNPVGLHYALNQAKEVK